MAKDNTPREPHRSFTVRIPESLYAEIGEAAHADGVFINNKVTQLLRLGLGHQIKLDQALARLLRTEALNV